MKHKYFKFYVVPVSDTYWIPTRARYVSDMGMKYLTFFQNKEISDRLGYKKDTGGYRGIWSDFFSLK